MSAVAVLLAQVEHGMITQDDAIEQLRPLESAIRSAIDRRREGMAKFVEDTRAYIRRAAARVGIDPSNYPDWPGADYRP